MQQRSGLPGNILKAGFVEKGIGKFTLLFFGTLIAVVGFCAYHILPFYYYYYEIQSHMQQAIKIASTETDQEIKKRLMYYIKKFQMPIDSADSLKIERLDRYMKIGLEYNEVFYITYKGKDYDIHTFHFNAYAEGPF